MSKLKEKHIDAELRSAQDIKEKKKEQWEQKQFLEEAEAIEKEIENIPDREEWESTEEKFQRLMKKAKERGLITESPIENAIDDKEDNKEDHEDTSWKKLNTEKDHAEKSTQKTRFSLIRRKVVKGSAVAAAIVFGIFGFTMRSEANRAYIMQKIDKMLGNQTRTEVDNNKTLVNDDAEEKARAEIEKTLNVKLPQFYYLPDGMEYLDYALDVEAKMAFLQYIYNEKIMYLLVYSSEKDASAISISDKGESIGNVSSKLIEGMQGTLWEVFEEEDKEPMYILQWDFKNTYYEFFGKLTKQEIENIGENIIY